MYLRQGRADRQVKICSGTYLIYTLQSSNKRLSWVFHLKIIIRFYILSHLLGVYFILEIDLFRCNWELNIFDWGKCKHGNGSVMMSPIDIYAIDVFLRVRLLTRIALIIYLVISYSHTFCTNYELSSIQDRKYIHLWYDS